MVENAVDGHRSSWTPTSIWLMRNDPAFEGGDGNVRVMTTEV